MQGYCIFGLATSFACPARPVKFFEEKERSEFNQGEIINQPALWNAKPIPPGLNACPVGRDYRTEVEFKEHSTGVKTISLG